MGETDQGIYDVINTVLTYSTSFNSEVLDGEFTDAAIRVLNQHRTVHRSYLLCFGDVCFQSKALLIIQIMM